MKGVKNWWFFVHWFIKFMTSRERQWAPAIRPGRWASFQVANEVLRHWLCTAKSCEKPWKNLPRLWYWGIGGKKCDHFGRKSNTTGKHGPVTVHPQLTALLSQTQQFSVFLWKNWLGLGIMVCPQFMAVSTSNMMIQQQMGFSPFKSIQGFQTTRLVVDPLVTKRGNKMKHQQHQPITLKSLGLTVPSLTCC